MFNLNKGKFNFTLQTHLMLFYGHAFKFTKNYTFLMSNPKMLQKGAIVLTNLNASQRIKDT